jgi:tetratricopeptide (TPR) repeat protein
LADAPALRLGSDGSVLLSTKLLLCGVALGNAVNSVFCFCVLLIVTAVAAQQPPGADPHFARGVEFQQEGKLEEAIAEYEQSIKTSPRFPVLANLGSVYARLGRFAEAIERYEQALSLSPGQPQILLNLGLAHYKTGNIQKGAALFSEVLKKQPTNQQARTLLADCFFQLGEYAKVIDELEPVADQNHNDLSIAYLLGTAYIRNKQVEKGQRLVDLILQKGDSAEAHIMMGTAFAEAQENKKAITEFERAIQSNPGIPLAHASLGLALIRSGDRERALAEFEQEVKINPNDFLGNFYLGVLRRRNNQNEEALPYLKKALQLRPGSDQAAFQIGLIHFQNRDLDQAQQILEDLAERFPDFIDVRITLARVYYRKKMKAEGDHQQEIVEKLRMEQQKREPGSQRSAELQEGEVTGGELEHKEPKP